MLNENGLVEVIRPSSKGHVVSKIQYEMQSFSFATLDEIRQLPTGDFCIFDVETYQNLFYVGMYFPTLNKVYGFELSETSAIDIDALYFILWKFCLVGFNIINYDLPILTYALSGKELSEIKFASDCIIQQNLRPYQFKEMFCCDIPDYNKIDLIEVCPLDGSLKTYAARLDCERMQDLPFAPDLWLDRNQIDIIENYCINDLRNTFLVFTNLFAQLHLRQTMSKKYNTDLMSKSDAQIAETVICRQIKSITGEWPKKVKTIPYSVNFVPPSNIGFKSPHLQELFKLICNAEFVLDNAGSPVLPISLKGFDLSLVNGVVNKSPSYTPRQSNKPEKWKAATVRIGNNQYRIGMGGLHSCETSVSYYASDDIEIADNDVASYYPMIVLNNQYEPEHLRGLFLPIYSEIVEGRLIAKKEKRTDDANSLKIVINGSFGKLGSKYSALYAPNLLLQVTICGQLYLLMLIEYLEMNGIEVISANTDGLVLRYNKSRRDDVRRYIKEWEAYTNFETEETLYKSLHIKDVNNYIAVKPDGKCKFKGEYANPWADEKNGIFRFHKNPENRVCIEAIEDYILNGTPVNKHIMNEKDIRKFLCVANVRGGAVKNDIYLGKVVRWYYKANEKKGIYYSGSGNQVQGSLGAWPCMDLPTELPPDIDYRAYYDIAVKMLYNLGILKRKEIKPLLI